MIATWESPHSRDPVWNISIWWFLFTFFECRSNTFCIPLQYDEFTQCHLTSQRTSWPGARTKRLGCFDCRIGLSPITKWKVINTKVECWDNLVSASTCVCNVWPGYLFWFNKEHWLERDDQFGQSSKFRVTAADKPSLQKDLTTDMRRSWREHRALASLKGRVK